MSAIKTSAMAGQRFGRLVVCGHAGKRTFPSGVKLHQWLCKCDCGREAVVLGTNLKGGHTTSCGCYSNAVRRSRLIDLTGKRFGRWTVLAFAGSKKRHRYWTCRCDCGTEATVGGIALSRGTSESCGCLSRELASDRATTHGLCGNPIVGIWHAMIARCHKPGASGYEQYGGRGIRVCDRWRESIHAFYADMGDRPSDQHTIERKDNNGDYCPENCTWATMKEQTRNTRNTILVTHNGKTQCLKDWVDELGLVYPRVTARIRTLGWTPLQALELEPR